MGENNSNRFASGALYLMNTDGNYKKVGEFSDITQITVADEDNSKSMDLSWIDKEFTISFKTKMSIRFQLWLLKSKIRWKIWRLFGGK